jgi:hypothetical protein
VEFEAITRIDDSIRDNVIRVMESI